MPKPHKRLKLEEVGCFPGMDGKIIVKEPLRFLYPYDGPLPEKAVAAVSRLNGFEYRKFEGGLYVEKELLP